MKKNLKYVLAALVALPILSWGSSSIGGEVDGGMGGVATTNFVVGATVTLISGAGNQAVTIASTTTDDNGRYSFLGVPSGFIQISVAADGYTPNPSTTVLAINSDTSLTVNFNLLTAGSQVISGTSSIGGQVSSTTGALAKVNVILRRRATATSTFVVVDSTTTDSYGAYLFSNISSAGNNNDINAYSLAVSTGGYNAFTSGAITVGDGVTVISNISLTVTAIQASSFKAENVRFSRLNGMLAIDLGTSAVSRTIEVYGLNGVIQNRIVVPTNVSRVTIPETFAPEKGFLYYVK